MPGRMLLPSLILLTAAGQAAVPPPLPEARDAKLERAIDSYAKAYVDAGHLAGQLVVAKDGRIVVERSWGFANRELRVPVTASTRMNIASITKPMTWTVARQLIAEGRLAGEDSVGKWIPGFHSEARITVEDLLVHRSGIPHRVTSEKDESQLLSPADVVELARTTALQFAPGSTSSYSSAGYTVLARILELAAGESYADLLRRRLFEPLGMTRSLHPSSREVMEDRASSYVPGLMGIENAPLKDMAFLAGAGSVYSTARDLLRLVYATVDGTLGATRRAEAVRGGRINWNGSSNGYRAFAQWDSASGVAIVYCGNVTTGAADRVRDAIPRILKGETLEPGRLPDVVAAGGAPRLMKIDPARIRRFEGVYQLFNGQRLEFRARGGVLTANEWILVPTSDSTFFSLRDYGIVAPAAEADGKFTALSWKIGEQSYPVTRIGDLPSETSATTGSGRRGT
jgi:CubicO group peptidase (beta-lactamase class C family)